MQVRKYEADNMRAALEMVKRELGPEAVIVATTPIQKGGLFKKARISVTAALEEKAHHLDEPDLSKPEVPVVLATPEPAAISDELQKQLEGLHKGLRALRFDLVRQEEDSPERSQMQEAMQEQLNDLKRIVGSMGAMSALSATSRRTEDSPDLYARILHQADVEPELARMVVEKARLRTGDVANTSEVRAQAQILKAVVAEELAGPSARNEKPDRPGKNANQSIIALVGPTGAGKTTSIAKLAVKAALVEHKRVALITLDTHRLGAADEISRYGELMGVPVHVVTDRAGFEAALQIEADAEVVFVDTAGRSPADGAHVAGLLRIFEGCGDGHGVRVLLTLPAHTRHSEIRGIVNRYAPLHPFGICVTKMDETKVLGALLNVRIRAGVPLAWVCFGHRIPEDMVSANVNRLSEQLVDGAFDMACAQPSGSVAIEPRPSEVQGWH